MARNAFRRSLWLFVLSLALGLILLLSQQLQAQNPKKMILRQFKKLGIDERTARFWVAVSAHETNYWRSRVYRDSYNLFNLIVPGSSRLSYGERQTVFNSPKESIRALVKNVWNPFHYPTSYQSLEELVETMKAKGFFTADKSEYLRGVKQAYARLYGN